MSINYLFFYLSSIIFLKYKWTHDIYGYFKEENLSMSKAYMNLEAKCYLLSKYLEITLGKIIHTMRKLFIHTILLSIT